MMPDRAGRPTPQDWAGIADTFNSAFRTINTQDAERRDLERRGRIDAYLNQIGTGQEIDASAPGYNYADHMAASGLHMQHLMNNEQYAGVMRAADEAKALERDKQVKEDFAQAQYFYYQAQNAKDPKQKQALQNQAYDALVPLYEYFPDGNKFVGWKDDSRTTMIFKDMKGNEFEHPAWSLDEAMKMAGGFAKGYVNNYLAQRQNINAKNADLLVKSATDPNFRMYSADGREAIYFAVYDVDGSGDIVLRQGWKDPTTGKTLKGFDESTGKEVNSSMVFRSKQYWDSVSDLSKDQEKMWVKATELAHKEYSDGIKEGYISPDESAQWQTDKTIEIYQLLAHNAPLPKGVRTAAQGQYALDDYRKYLVSGPATSMAGGELMSAHKPGEYGIAASSPGQDSEKGLSPIPAAATNQDTGKKKDQNVQKDNVNGYEKVWLDDSGIIWGKKNGKTSRIAKNEKKDLGLRFKPGTRQTYVQQNPKYQDYVAELKKYNIYDQAQKMGFVE